jgi:hypothetical protein
MLGIIIMWAVLFAIVQLAGMHETALRPLRLG